MNDVVEILVPYSVTDLEEAQSLVWVHPKVLILEKNGYALTALDFVVIDSGDDYLGFTNVVCKVEKCGDRYVCHYTSSCCLAALSPYYGPRFH